MLEAPSILIEILMSLLTKQQISQQHVVATIVIVFYLAALNLVVPIQNLFTILSKNSNWFD